MSHQLAPNPVDAVVFDLGNVLIRWDPAPAIAAAAEVGGVEWLIVELDHADGPVVDAVRGSAQFLFGRGLARPSAR
jgi:hypothetical protein